MLCRGSIKFLFGCLRVRMFQKRRRTSIHLLNTKPPYEKCFILGYYGTGLVGLVAAKESCTTLLCYGTTVSQVLDTWSQAGFSVSTVLLYI